MHANIPDIPLVLSYLSTQVVMPALGKLLVWVLE